VLYVGCPQCIPHKTGLSQIAKLIGTITPAPEVERIPQCVKKTNVAVVHLAQNHVAIAADEYLRGAGEVCAGRVDIQIARGSQSARRLRTKVGSNYRRRQDNHGDA
jgi:hypothetical protein